MNQVLSKKILLRGEKGDSGGEGTDSTIPYSGIIAFKGDTIPTGYQLYSEVPDGVLTHITATYTQTVTITDASSLDDLRQDLVVKAYYYDEETGTTSEYVVTDYTLSGTLEVGTSTITASYKGKSDSFDVTVETSITYLYNWDFTQSLTDSVRGITAELNGSATRDNGGVHITNASSYIEITASDISVKGRTMEIDFDTTDLQSASAFFIRVAPKSENYRGFFYSGSGYWVARIGTNLPYTTTSTNKNVFNKKTFKMIMISKDEMIVYANNDLVYAGEFFLENNKSANTLRIGDNSYSYFDMTIKAVRIYANQ